MINVIALDFSAFVVLRAGADYKQACEKHRDCRNPQSVNA